MTMERRRRRSHCKCLSSVRLPQRAGEQPMADLLVSCKEGAAMVLPWQEQEQSEPASSESGGLQGPARAHPRAPVLLQDQYGWQSAGHPGGKPPLSVVLLCNILTNVLHLSKWFDTVYHVRVWHPDVFLVFYLVAYKLFPEDNMSNCLKSNWRKKNSQQKWCLQFIIGNTNMSSSGIDFLLTSNLCVLYVCTQGWSACLCVFYWRVYILWDFRDYCSRPYSLGFQYHPATAHIWS